MNPKFTAVAVAVALGSVTMGFALVAHADGDVASAVEKLEKEMRQAQMDNDSNWYQQNLADGYIEGHSWGDWNSKAEVLKDAQSKTNKITKGDVSDMKVSTYGSKVAVARYKFTYDATIKGTHRARAVICSDTWIDQSGAWKLVSDHCSHVEGT